MSDTFDLSQRIVGKRLGCTPTHGNTSSQNLTPPRDVLSGGPEEPVSTPENPAAGERDREAGEGGGQRERWREKERGRGRGRKEGEVEEEVEGEVEVVM